MLVVTRRYRPENTLLYRAVDEHYPAFTAHLAEQGRKQQGYVQHKFEVYMKCRCLSNEAGPALSFGWFVKDQGRALNRFDEKKAMILYDAD